MIALCALSIIGCAPRQEASSPPEPVHATEAGMPCSQATRAVRAALLRMGYTVVAAEAASAERAGKVTATKTSGWAPAVPEPGAVYTATVVITCSDRGSELEAVTDEPWMARMAFRRDFAKTVSELAEQKTRRPGIDDAPPSGLSVAVEPLRAREAVGEFGVDLPAAGITPVRLRIENRSERAYLFRRSKVRLITESGTRTKPLTAERVTPALVPPGDRQLARTLIANGEIAPGQSVTGFLFFPASAYRGASVVLIDRETDETEGLGIEF